MYLYICIVFILAVLLLNGYFLFAIRYNIIDKPNERSSHSKNTIRGGGIIFPIIAVINELYSGLPNPWFIAGLIIIALVSFIDDVISLKAILRIIIQLIVLVLMFTELGLIPAYLILIVPLGLGFINGYNFMDGINGITGLYSLIGLLTMYYINNNIVIFIDDALLLVIMISTIVFLFYNLRKKAKCFAGDVGSVSLAFMMFFLLLSLVIKTNDIIYLFFFSVYGIDITFTLIERVGLKQNVFEPHRMHLYQLLSNEYKIPHVYVSFTFAIIQLALNIGLIISIEYLSVIMSYIIMVVTNIILSIVYIKIKNYLKNNATILV